MEELGRYQSRLAQHALAAHAAQAEARTIALHAAALLIDVRGYTDVVHDAAVSGLERIEDLGTSLNAFFSGLIEAVAREGGDVIGFAGDSMLALFPAAHPEQLPHAARRAAAAALAVRGAQVVTSSPEAQVRTYAQSRISLACGPAWSIAFGRAGRTQHVLAAGVVLARVAACDRVGTPGMVAVHPSICEALAGAGLLAPIVGVDPNLAQELRSLTQGSDASEPLSAPDLDDLLLLGSLPAAITDRKSVV